MHTAYIAVGSNIGDRENYITLARILLTSEAAIHIAQESSVIETVPIGGPPQDMYLNAVWKLETSFSPHMLLLFLQHIEKTMGRKRTERNGPRVIDLDILLYDTVIINTAHLTIPHQRLHEREFILQLLFECYPLIVHPVLKHTVTDLLNEIRHEQSQDKAHTQHAT